MRRVLNQAANAAVKAKGSIFELLYRRFVVRLGHAQAIGAIAHRLCRLVWKILHDGVTYEERGPAVSNARAHGELPRCFANFGASAIGSNSRQLRQGTRCDGV